MTVLLVFALGALVVVLFGLSLATMAGARLGQVTRDATGATPGTAVSTD